MDGCTGDHVERIPLVSRMSTAVLAGAQLEIGSLIQKLIIFPSKEAAQKLSFLRQNRGIWRQQLEQSPLGDPLKGVLSRMPSDDGAEIRCCRR